MSVPVKEQRAVCVGSGNRCAYCRTRLTMDTPSGEDVVLGAIAHIVAEQIDGPRGGYPLDARERTKAANLMLLCSPHHQLVDSDVAYYTVERLREMKAFHEAWVNDTLERAGSAGLPDGDGEMRRDRLYCTALPVERFPSSVWVASTDLSEVQARDAAPWLPPYLIRSKRLITFDNLSRDASPFRSLVDLGTRERHPSQDYWDESESARWFVELCSRGLNKLTGHRGLRLDKVHRRFYFAPDTPGEDRQVEYQPLNKRRSTRKVVWQPQSRRGFARSYFLHRAVALRFLRTDSSSWCLTIRPELHVTRDGEHPLSSSRVGSKVTRKKARLYNHDLLAEIQFWRDYLGDSGARIVIPVGSHDERIVVSTSLLDAEIAWPGIPEKHKLSFQNVHYLDDLLSWGEDMLTEDEEEDDWEWDEQPSSDLGLDVAD